MRVAPLSIKRQAFTQISAANAINAKTRCSALPTHCQTPGASNALSRVSAILP
jgi:hypothetical protein